MALSPLRVTTFSPAAISGNSPSTRTTLLLQFTDPRNASMLSQSISVYPLAAVMRTGMPLMENVPVP